ncbi:MAG: uroporphyrinogen-III synthase [Gallionella sp.]|nr:uroporphyrinogen-III synthase [Gallionella sp.]
MANLNGRRILVTRPSHQAGGLAQGILAAGGEPVLFPLLEISPVADTAALHAQISQLADYQLAIFISPNAVEQGVAAIRKVGLKPTCRIATVGQASAQVLRALGFDHILVPRERFDSEGLLALPELQDVAGWRVMIFRGDGGRALLGDTLKARGAIVDYATCYQRSTPLPAAIDWHHLDAITITSSEALTYLRQLITEAQLSIPLFVPHPRIAALAQQQGWQHIYPTDSGDLGLLSGLNTWAS